MARRRMPGRCPVCDEELAVTRLKCPSCETAIEGQFELSRLARLSKEQMDFVEIFIKCRGNIKEVERELGISYPTVRGRLDQVIAALGYRVESDEQPQARSDRRKEILDALGRGEMTTEEAVKLLKQL
jgi:hypothetical protein